MGGGREAEAGSRQAACALPSHDLRSYTTASRNKQKNKQKGFLNSFQALLSLLFVL